MGAEELKRLLGQLQNSNALLLPAPEQIPAADLTSGNNASKMLVSPTVDADADMAKMTAQELDEFRTRNRMKERKPPGVQQSALTIAPRAAAPKATSVVSEGTSQSLTNGHQFATQEIELRDDRPSAENAPVVTATRIGPVDLEALRRDIIEWTEIQATLNRAKSQDRQGRRRDRAAQLTFLILAVGFFVFLAYSSINQ